MTTTFSTQHSAFGRLRRGLPAGRRVRTRLDAWAIVGLQITECVLNASEQMFEERRHGVVSLVVAVRHVEEASFALAADPAQCVIVIGALTRFLRLVLGRHLVVVDA